MNMETGLSAIIFDTESNVVTDIFVKFDKIEWKEYEIWKNKTMAGAFQIYFLGIQAAVPQ